MTASHFRGVFAIPVTPFDERGGLDEASLRRCVDFCVASGAHGVVAPVNAGEFTSLTDAERVRVAEITLEQVAGRAPVVIGVSGVSTEHALAFARHAATAGADAIMAMPPYLLKATPSEIFRYFAALSDAVTLPIFVQNWVGPVGTPMPAELVARMVREIEHVRYVKEETLWAGQTMSAIIAQAGPRLLGLMGGVGGRFLLDEYRRGACGTMPACEVVDLHVQLWELLEAGDTAGARAFFGRMLPLLSLESLYGVPLCKAVLHRRGIIATPTMRAPGSAALDHYDLAELDAIMSDLAPLLRG